MDCQYLHNLYFCSYSKRNNIKLLSSSCPREGFRSRIARIKYYHLFYVPLWAFLAVLNSAHTHKQPKEKNKDRKAKLDNLSVSFLIFFFLAFFLLFYSFFVSVKVFVKLNPSSNIFQCPKVLVFGLKNNPLKYFHLALKINLPNIAKRGPKIFSVLEIFHSSPKM